LALLHLTASVRRLVVTILAVAIGVGLVVAVRLMNAAVLSSFLELRRASRVARRSP